MTRSRRTFQLAGLFSALAVLGLVLVAIAEARTASPTRTVVKTVVVTVKDSSVQLTPKTVPAGSVKFSVKNLSTKPHRFSVGGHTTSTIAPGKTTTLTVSFTKGGAYTARVLLNGGRTVKLTVTGGTTSGGTGGAAQIAVGKKVFMSSGCGKCHILAAAGSKGTIGPNLDQAKPSMARVVSQVTSGGGFMPSFGGTLSKTKIDAVAAFVYSSTH